MVSRMALSTALAATLVAAPAAAEVENPGDAIGSLPDAALWHFKLFHVFPRNVDAFNAAKAARQAELKPGEFREYYIAFRKAPDGTPLLFEALVDAEKHDKHGSIMPLDWTLVARIRLEGAGLRRVHPLWPLDETTFGRILRGAGDGEAKVSPPGPSRLKYGDHVAAVRVLNAELGFDDELSAWSGSGGPPAWAPKVAGKLLDLLDPSCRAPAGSRVILVARRGEPTYSVWNVEAGKSEGGYQKKGYLGKLGNTVWVRMTTADSREYTVVYHGLEEVAAEPGQVVEAKTPIGRWKSAEARSGGLEAWRVHGPKTRFLRGTEGEAGPAYRVLPALDAR